MGVSMSRSGPQGILVVEDDQEVRCLLEREIAELGHGVRTARDAEGALRLLAVEPCAVVVTDIRMPGMDGVELTRVIKDRWPETEVIIITGFASVDSASRAVRLGACDYLVKPVGDIDRIGESLDRALVRQRQRRALKERVVSLQIHRDTLAGLLDRLPQGVILLGGRGQIVLKNSVARQLTCGPEGLILDADGGLTASTGAAAEGLREVVERAVDPRGRPRRGGVVVIPRPAPRLPLSLLVTPVNEEVGPDDPACAVFVSDPGRRAGTTEDLLCRLYNVTSAEARVAAVVMQGKSVDEAAEELAISPHTARTHLKRVFGKTNTTRQGDLISLLLCGPALLVPERGEEA